MSAVLDSPSHISVKVRDSRGGVMTLKIKYTTQLAMLVTAYAAFKRLHPIHIRLFLDYRELRPDCSPQEEGVCDGDTIYVMVDSE